MVSTISSPPAIQHDKCHNSDLCIIIYPGNFPLSFFLTLPSPPSPPSPSSSHLLLLLALSHWPVVFLLVEDLLHLAVLQIVQLTHRILGPLDEVNENARRAFPTHKIMLHRERGTEVSGYFKKLFKEEWKEGSISLEM